mmetsp:Transcript_3002/g.6856  ORF Transcript_3002/g.6856 Transcript_3002/m.6856 type:complete len:206 (+) Transcript_3002:668-1285(+)|eukprot:CAMPEP_0197579970 /NCGR_PEP_ID=MMETSP1326-20131121/3871_1 /TAXON_ID=1155430 /ORGANISM="Genus nov. species nov., Strain RCC2288" /LENGTH=205 /DNA_ID=CAMNT_0043143597 /DNA_START=485 /DNA_END=1102 /DNA_ORIENTATION=+
MKNPNALAEAQSASEVFDVMLPPQSEGFDIFTMKGVPTGEAKARALVHRDKDWHRSVHVWLVDRAAQQVALQKRSPNKDTFPNRWDISAAGHIESGQDSVDTAVRELAEELGVVTTRDELEFAFTVPAAQAGLGGCNCFEDVYFLERALDVEMAIGEAEVTAVKWMGLGELEAKMRAGDADIVPRDPVYVQAFFAHLATKYAATR